MKTRSKWLVPACVAVGATVTAVSMSNELALTETVALAVAVGLLAGFLARSLVLRKRSGDS